MLKLEMASSQIVSGIKKLREHWGLSGRTLELVPSSATPRSATLLPTGRAVLCQPAEPRAPARDLSGQGMLRPGLRTPYQGAAPWTKKKLKKIII